MNARKILLLITGLGCIFAGATAQQEVDVDGDIILRDNTPAITLFDLADDRIEGVIRESSDDIQLVSYFGNLEFATSAGGAFTQRMTLLGSNGNLGINTTAPAVKLHIQGGTDAEPSGGGFAQFGTTSSINVAVDNNEIMARNNGAPADFFIQHDGGNLLLCGTEAGSVGIGILQGANIPGDYLLAVDGKIIGEEVRVELSGSWPDYVFDEDYDLLSIEDLEKSIADNGHLPGIPDAAEIEEGGIILGDMQKRLLEKVEELTLYIIRQQREITVLKEDMETLKGIRK